MLDIDVAIKHCLEMAEQNEIDSITYKNCKEIKTNMYEKLLAEKVENDCKECAADHRQLAEWLQELKNLRAENKVLTRDCLRLIKSNEKLREKLGLIANYKRLLKSAVDDFAKLDRENAKNKNCMMPEMDCADCPLSWDSVDDRIEPCHSWRYTNEALKLIWR